MDEFKFLVEKGITIISSTLSLKRAYINDIYKSIESKIYSHGKDKFSKIEYMRVMMILSREVTYTVDDLSNKFTTFTK